MKKKLRFFKIYYFIFFSSIYAIATCHNPVLNIETLPPPYNEIDNILPYRPHGWYGNKKEIEIIFNKHKPKVVVELGSWLGQSTCHMASLLGNDGKMYAY